VRRRGAERQRAHHDAERAAAIGAEPRRHELQARRVDAGEEHAGEETQRQAEPGTVRESERRVRGRRRDRGEHEQQPRRHQVDEVRDRRDQSRR
jgi:hypothetical protein